MAVLPIESLKLIKSVPGGMSLAFFWATAASVMVRTLPFRYFEVKSVIVTHVCGPFQ